MTTETLPRSREEFIRENYSPQKAKFILSILTEEEILAINATEGMIPEEDYFYVALTNRILQRKPELVERFEKAKILDQRHYLQTEIPWMQTSASFLELKEHRKPGAREEAEAFQEQGTGKRYRVFYCVKFREKVEIPKT